MPRISYRARLIAAVALAMSGAALMPALGVELPARPVAPANPSQPAAPPALTSTGKEAVEGLLDEVKQLPRDVSAAGSQRQDTIEDNLRDEIDRLERDLERREVDLDNFDDDLKLVADRLRDIDEDRGSDRRRERIEAAEARLDELEAELNALEAQLRDLQASLRNIKQQVIIPSGIDKAALREDVRNLAQQITSFDNAVERFDLKVLDLRDHVTDIR